MRADTRVATKRVLRALLKAIDLCVSNPEAVARRTVDGGNAPSYAYALGTLKDARFDRWREFDPEERCASMRCGCATSA